MAWACGFVMYFASLEFKGRGFLATGKYERGDMVMVRWKMTRIVLGNYTTLRPILEIKVQQTYNSSLLFVTQWLLYIGLPLFCARLPNKSKTWFYDALLRPHPWRLKIQGSSLWATKNSGKLVGPFLGVQWILSPIVISKCFLMSFFVDAFFLLPLYLKGWCFFLRSAYPKATKTSIVRRCG